jgi:hypothetical protein
MFKILQKTWKTGLVTAEYPKTPARRRTFEAGRHLIWNDGRTRERPRKFVPLAQLPFKTTLVPAK